MGKALARGAAPPIPPPLSPPHTGEGNSGGDRCAIAASPAAVLASHVAVALLVVRADKTSESALREAAALLKGGAQVQLLLNAVRYTGGARRFGSYYGKGEAG